MGRTVLDVRAVLLFYWGMHTFTLRHILARSASLLTTSGVDSPGLSARILAAHALGLGTRDIILREEVPLPPEQVSAILALVGRRSSGEPVAYLTGKREFFGRDFSVTPATLIPRPETEEMVEVALELRLPRAARFVDMGTGSGCIAVTLAAERPEWQGCMVDISGPALAVACSNAKAHTTAQRLLPVLGDLCRPPLLTGVFDLVISNPPYVSAAEYDTLDREVRDFEPPHALTPDATGLAHVRAIAHHARRVLRAGGWCLVEHGAAQGEAVWDIFSTTGAWRDVDIRQDLAGLDRFCVCRAA